jgi:hypothetical protein
MGKQPGNRQNLPPSIFAVKNRLGNTLKDNPFFLAVLVTLTTFLLYLATLISEVGWGDSAELSLAAYQLGLTHPPGYPLYTILGKAVSAFFTDPAVGVNLLSAACTGLAAGVLSLLIYEFTSAPVIAALGAVLFAVLPNIWDMAVVSEVYNVNIFFLGISIYLFLRSEQSQFTKYFVPSAVLFGLSLGTYQANLLLLPAFLWVLYARTPREKILSRLFAFCSIIGSIWLVFIGYSAVRSHAALAINYPLNSAREILSYITGAGLRPSYPGTIAFYIDRTIQHAGIFSKNFLYLPIPVGVLGAFALFKQKRIPGLFLVFAFAINYLFFSYYAVSDYFTMPVPAYFIFCIWIGCGLAVIASWLAERKSVWKFVSIFICLLVIGGQLAGQLPARLERSNTHPVTDLIIPAMNSFPQNAVVISRWERYAPMVYFQQVRKMRGDITLVVSYDYLDQIDTYLHNTPARPVFIDNNDKTLIKNYKIERYYRRWFIILAPIGK